MIKKFTLQVMLACLVFAFAACQTTPTPTATAVADDSIVKNATAAYNTSSLALAKNFCCTVGFSGSTSDWEGSRETDKTRVRELSLEIFAPSPGVATVLAVRAASSRKGSNRFLKVQNLCVYWRNRTTSAVTGESGSA